SLRNRFETATIDASRRTSLPRGVKPALAAAPNIRLIGVRNAGSPKSSRPVRLPAASRIEETSNLQIGKVSASPTPASAFATFSRWRYRRFETVGAIASSERDGDDRAP